MENQTANSKFIGGAFANFFINLATLVFGILSLGLAYPALVCWKLRWMASKTYINGRRLVFDGKAMQLFGSYLLWLLLSVATFGIYAIFVMPLNMQRWENKHTHFEGESGTSVFDGSIWGLFGVRILTTFVNIITLSFGSYWSHCYRERWYRKHQIIDEYRMSFDGTGMQYFGKKFVWRLLTIITLGIYSFWLFVKSEHWTISHVHFASEEKIAVSQPKEIKFPLPGMGLFFSVGGILLSMFFSMSGWGLFIVFFIGLIVSAINLKKYLKTRKALLNEEKVASPWTVKKVFGVIGVVYLGCQFFMTLITLLIG